MKTQLLPEKVSKANTAVCCSFPPVNAIRNMSWPCVLAKTEIRPGLYQAASH